jgi:uncharacterized protein (DUF3084 family)
MILLTLVITLGIVCGFIAYVGDYLGKRLGKKRVTLLGLRPRQTAVLISVATGVCIFLVAFAGILTADQNARRALLTFHSLRQTNQQLTSTNRSLTASSQKLRQDKQGLEREKNRLTDEVKFIHRQLQEIEPRLAQAQAELTQKRKELGQKLEELREKKQALHQVQQALQTVETALNITEAKLTETKKQVVEQTKLKEAREVQAYKVGQQNLELERQHDKLLAEKQKLTEEVQRLEQRLNEWKVVVDKLMRERVIIGANEVMASRTMRDAADAADVRKELEQLLTEANRAAKERGAEASEDQRRPLMLATKVIFSGDQRVYVHEDQIINNAVEEIVSSRKSLVVDVAAERNFVAGEPVLARLAFHPNQMVFQQGAYIFSKEVDCSQHKAGLFHEILNLLEEVKQVADRQGVRPRQELTYEDGTNEKIFDLLDRLDAFHGRAQVSVVAAKNLWTADQLSVRFEVNQIVK